MDRYAQSPVLAERETRSETPEGPVVKRLRVVRDEGSKHPLLRVEDEWREGPGGRFLLRQVAMVADHVIVKPTNPAMSEADFLVQLKQAGATVRRRMPSSGIWLVAFPPEDLLDAVPQAVRSMGDRGDLVRYAEPDYIAYASGFPNDLNFGSLWGLHNTGQTGGTVDADIDAPEAWEYHTGSRTVKVGIIDSGIDYKHPDLEANIWTNPREIAGNGIDDDHNGYIDDVRGWDFRNNDNDPKDDNRHGTHCAGTIGALGGNGTGVVGVCWQVSMVPLKFLGSNGSGATSDAVEAVSYATSIGVTLTSNSWGGGPSSTALRDAINAADAAGILFVAAAGNSTSNNDSVPSFPASYAGANIISVAATKSRDALASFSNYGAVSVDIAAPGDAIYSTVPGNSYTSLSGTSMATPHVAGACALLKAFRPELTGREIRDLILRTGDPLPALTGKVATGKRLNVRAALEEAADVVVGGEDKFVASGPQGGPFTPSVASYAISNFGDSPATVTVARTQPWLTLSATSVPVAVGGSATVTATVNASAASLQEGVYTDTVTFTAGSRTFTRTVKLIVGSRDYFTEWFSDTPQDTDYQSFLFTPGLTSSGYFALREAVTAFPTDLTNVTTVALTDDDSGLVSLTGGQRVQLYGQSYSQFYVGSNGYITFGGPDTGGQESFERHFQMPRVSALFDDLSPTRGAVTWKQLTDRVAVTWLAVPQNGMFDSNSFQIELFFDGRIRITHLQVDAQDGLIGLSRGGGVPDDFVESDFSSFADSLLTLTVPPAIREGDGVRQGTVQLSEPLAADLTVTLSSSAPDQLSVPATVTVPKGQVSATFDLTVVDDALLDGAQDVTVTLSSSSFRPTTAVVSVEDNEQGLLTLSVPPTVVEGSGQVQGTVSVHAAPARNVTVLLNSSLSSEVRVPASVLILAGQTSATFFMTVENDGAIDGPQEVTLTAQVGGWADAHATVQVQDDENTALTLSFTASVREGTSATGTVSISGTLFNSLEITLSSNSEARLGSSTVTIPAGATSATFDLTAPDNALTDGTASITLTASTPGFTDATKMTEVLDDDVHHFAVSAIGQQIPNAPFSVTLSAQDVNGVTIPSFTGSAALTAAGSAGAVTVSPTSTGAFTAGVWTGNVRVTAPDLQVVLTASAGGVSGSSAPFDVVIGPVHHFTIVKPNGGLAAHQSYPVTVSARDVAENVVPTFTGKASLSVTGAALGGTLLTTPSPSWSGYNTKPLLTVGYAFTPTSDLRVTALRTYRGAKATIWKEANQVVASVPITAAGGTWSETPLPTPVVLQAGVTYRIGALIPQYQYWPATDYTGSYFVHGTILQSYEILADGRPDKVITGRPLVDLRYDPITVQVPLSITETGDFSAGVWTGNLELGNPAAQVRLRATDSAGHTGETALFDCVGRITLTAPASVTETGSITGTVTLSETPLTEFTVRLSNSDVRQATVPTSVRILPGQRTATFPISGYNDNAIDGTQSVVITAAINEWLQGTASVDVLDDENRTLSLSSARDVSEGSGSRFSVYLSGTLTTPLEVTLQSSDPSQLFVDPLKVTIPAGYTSADFGIMAPDNALFDGSRSVTISASAPGFTAAATPLKILDNDLHHLTMSAIPSPSFAGQEFRVDVYGRSVDDVGMASANIRLDVAVTARSDSGPITLTSLYYSSYAGTVSVTFRIPTPAKNVVITARETSKGLTVSSNPFDVQAGPVDHFEWAPIPTKVPSNLPIPVTITAKDSANNVVTSFSDPVNLSAIGGSYRGNIFPNSSTAPSVFNLPYEMTLGIDFTPQKPMWITSLSSYNGTKITLWEAFTNKVLATVSTPRSSVGWAGAPLPAPILLQANHTYSIGALTSGRKRYYRTGVTSPPHLSLSNGTHAVGDAKPYYDSSSEYPLVDFTYEAQVQNPIPVSPEKTGNFVNGRWTGNLSIPQSESFITLLAQYFPSWSPWTPTATGESTPFSTSGGLTLTLPAEIPEGTTNSTATLSLSSPTSSALIVNLASSDGAALTVPSSVTVPAGQTSVAFTITAPPDGRMEDRQVIVTAIKTDWIGANAKITVKDNSPAIVANGTLLAWGSDNNGQVGVVSGLSFAKKPTPVIAPAGALAGKKIAAIASSRYHNLALTKEGGLYAWGANWSGQLGNNSTANPWASVAVIPGALAGKTIVAIAAGDGFSMALSVDGEVFTWGSGNQGRLGTGQDADCPVPVRVIGLTGKKIVKIAAGFQFGLALDDAGRVYAWGNNWGGQLGDGTLVERRSAVLVNKGALTGKRVVDISAGVNHSLVLTSEGQLVAWGSNYEGELGDGTYITRTTPVLVKASGLGEGRRFIAIAAGAIASFAITSDHRLVAWGSAMYGQLGVGINVTSGTYPLPRWVDGDGLIAGRRVFNVAVGYAHVLALTDDMRLYAWGANESGQLGNGTTNISGTPVPVSLSLPEGSAISSLACGWAHSLALTTPSFVGLPELALYEGTSTDTAALADGGNLAAGTVQNGLSLSRTLTIANVGRADLEISDLLLEGKDADDFAVSEPGTTTLPPGGSTTFTLTFAPNHTGACAATLRILSNAAGDGSMDIALSGMAIAPPATTLALGGTFFTVNEQDGVVNVPITRRDSLVGTVTVKLRTAIGTAGAADFTPLTQVVTFDSGVASVTVPVAITDTPDSVEVNEAFTVSLSEPSPGARMGTPATATVQILDATDAILPGAPAITAPAAGAKLKLMPGTSVTVTGTATDNQGVDTVEASLDGGVTYTPASVTLTGTGAAYGKTATYTVAVTPVAAGPQMLQVRTTDLRGNVSPVALRSFGIMAPLTVNLQGRGSVTAGFSPSSFRDVGQKAIITATPVTGWIFAGWVASGGPSLTEIGVNTADLERPTLTFTFREGLTLTARFVESPYLANGAGGSYCGLAQASPSLPDRPEPQRDGTPVNFSTQGAFSATVTSTGSLSGKLVIEGRALTFVGLFDHQGQARFGTAREPSLVLARPGKPGYILALNIGLAGSEVPQGQIRGSVSVKDPATGQITAVSVVEADVDRYNGTSVPAPATYLGVNGATSTYTLLMECNELMTQSTPGPGTTASLYPQGYGVGSFTLSKAGLVTAAGTTADGATFIASARLTTPSPDGHPRFGLHASLYNNTGFLCGFVGLDNQLPASDMAATDLQWVRPAQTAAAYFPAGWPQGLSVTLLAARYQVTAGQSVLLGAYGQPLSLPDADGNARLSFYEGLLSGPLEKAVNLSVADGVTKVPVNDATFTLGVIRSTGTFSGTMRHSNGTLPAFKGVIYQKGMNAGGYGHFLTVKPAEGQSGGVMLIRQP